MPASLTPVATLPGGSNQLAVSGLIPNAQYTVNVAHLEPAPAVGYTPIQALTFTTGPGSATATAPDDPIPFCLPQKTGLWMCGCAAWQNELVAGTALVFNEAVETGAGTNTFGTFAEVYRIAADPGTWGVYLQYLPIDGKRRMYQVYADRPGVTPSAMTASVMVLPGSVLNPQDYPVAVPTLTYTEGASAAPNIQTTGLIATYTVPADHQFDHMEYLVQQQTTPGVWTTGQIVIGGSNSGPGGTQNDTIVTLPSGTAGQSVYNITPIAVTSGSTAGAFIPLIPILPVRTYGISTSMTVTPLPNAPVVTGGVSGGSANFTVDFTNSPGTAYVRMYAIDYGTVAPSPIPDTVEGVSGSPGYVAPDITPPSQGTVATRSLTLAASHIMYATFVPYNSAGQRGPYTTIPNLVGTASGALTAPTVAVATFPGPGGGNWAFPSWVGIKVTFVSAPTAGDLVMLYRDAAQWSQYTITSADVSAGFATVLDTGSSAAAQVKNYSADQTHVATNAKSPISASTAVTIRAGFTLTTPTFGESALLAAQTPTPRVPPGGGSGGSKHVWILPGSYLYPPSALGDIKAGLALGALHDFGSAPIGTKVQVFYPGFPSPGTIYVQGTVSAPGYTTSAVGSTTYPYP
jgi:hypothetical protein